MTFFNFLLLPELTEPSPTNFQKTRNNSVSFTIFSFVSSSLIYNFNYRKYKRTMTKLSSPQQCQRSRRQSSCFNTPKSSRRSFISLVAPPAPRKRSHHVRPLVAGRFNHLFHGRHIYVPHFEESVGSEKIQLKPRIDSQIPLNYSSFPFLPVIDLDCSDDGSEASDFFSYAPDSVQLVRSLTTSTKTTHLLAAST